MWYTENGNMGDVALSTRVRLARNIASIPFDSMIDEIGQQRVIDECRSAVGNDTSIKFIDLGQMKDYERQELAEKHLISPEMVTSDRKIGLLLSDDLRTAVMLNEEDHIRIQYMTAGFDPECLEAANKVDDMIEEKVIYSFDPQFGYLTCCPTNVGTGLRASVMVFLPAIVMSKMTDKIIHSISSFGMVVRGLYGEGSKPSGSIFQISNQVTLGISEEETMDKLAQIVNDVVEIGRTLRKNIHEKDTYKLEDRILRSYGILTNARLLSSAEALSLISDVRLGINLGIINNIPIEKLNEAMYDTFPATIIKEHNIFNAIGRDIKRAEIMKEKLGAKV